MRCFIAVDEATLLRLWLKDPALIQPFTRPFYPIRRGQSAANESLVNVAPPNVDVAPSKVDAAQALPSLTPLPSSCT